MEATITLGEQSGVAEARRVTKALAQSLECSDLCQANAALIVTEAATNILKYAGRGQILLRSYQHNEVHGIELIALDQGPGIANLERASHDGYSTGGSLGAGLGTIARHSNLFDMYSIEGQGTALLARIDCPSRSRLRVKPVRAAPADTRTLTVGARSTPKAGQEICGDGWAMRWAGERFGLVLLDGLGHGPLAADASRRAMDIFHHAPAASGPADMLRAAHLALKGSRGAVMAAAVWDPVRQRVDFAGVGNIVCNVQTRAGTQHLLSMDGTVGYNMRLIRENSADWPIDAVLIASTDGLSTRWNLNRHPGLTQHHPSLIAAVLHRDFGKDSDDATVVVVKAQ